MKSTRISIMLLRLQILGACVVVAAADTMILW